MHIMMYGANEDAKHQTDPLRPRFDAAFDRANRARNTIVLCPDVTTQTANATHVPVIHANVVPRSPSPKKIIKLVLLL